MTTNRLAIAAVASVLAVHGAHAGDGKAAAKQAIEAYRQQLRDDNPAELYESVGEELWKKPAGPKNVSLEQCDLGLGAGVVKGAYARLPRYFKDTGKVQDVESRVLTCMEKLQGIDARTYADAPLESQQNNDLNALAVYIGAQSNGDKVDPGTAKPEEKRMYALGRRMFQAQPGSGGFPCAACHGSVGSRAGARDLADLASPAGAAAAWTTWPAYRISIGEVWGMRQRLDDCMRQEHVPPMNGASDIATALETFMAVNARGATMNAPGIKR